MTETRKDSVQNDLLGARRAIHRAAMQAHGRARQLGIQIAIWEAGQVRYVSPDTCKTPSKPDSPLF